MLASSCGSSSRAPAITSRTCLKKTNGKCWKRIQWVWDSSDLLAHVYRYSHDVTRLAPVLQAVSRLPFLLRWKSCLHIFGACVSVLHRTPRSIWRGNNRTKCKIKVKYDLTGTQRMPLPEQSHSWKRKRPGSSPKLNVVVFFFERRLHLFYFILCNLMGFCGVMLLTSKHIILKTH